MALRSCSIAALEISNGGGFVAAEIVRRSFQIGDRVFELVNGFGDARMMLHLAVNILGCGKRDRQRKQTSDSTCKNDFTHSDLP